MVVFPLIAFGISAACAAVIGYDAWRRPKPDRVVWTIAFVIFAVAAGVEVLGSLTEWSATLARIYYLCGAVLVVGYLALGEGYLLARSRIEKYAPGVTILVTAIAITLVIDAPVDASRLAGDGWDALERGTGLTALTMALNIGGTLVLAGGALYSARKFRKLGIQRNRMMGCVLIALGTIVVAMGGSLTRLGQREYLYIAMSVGVATIFAGVLQTRRPDTSVATSADGTGGAQRGEKPQLIPLPGTSARGGKNGADPGLAYIESRLQTLSIEELSNDCAIWSVAAAEIEVFDRTQARLAWSFRSLLIEPAQDQFDALPPAVRLQLAELYTEVFTPPEDVAQSG